MTRTLVYLSVVVRKREGGRKNRAHPPLFLAFKLPHSPSDRTATIFYGQSGGKFPYLLVRQRGSFDGILAGSLGNADIAAQLTVYLHHQFDFVLFQRRRVEPGGERGYVSPWRPRLIRA